MTMRAGKARKPPRTTLKCGESQQENTCRIKQFDSYRLWCGRPDSNRHEKSLNGFSYTLRLSPPPTLRSWSGLSLNPGHRL